MSFYGILAVSGERKMLLRPLECPVLFMTVPTKNNAVAAGWSFQENKALSSVSPTCLSFYLEPFQRVTLTARVVLEEPSRKKKGDKTRVSWLCLPLSLVPPTVWARCLPPQ